MKNLSLFFLLSLCMNVEAFAEEVRLHCQATFNSSSFETDVVVADYAKEVSLGELETYEIFVKSLGEKKIELQAYDFIVPERVYATAVLNEHNDNVNLSVWRRDSLLEAKCSLID